MMLRNKYWRLLSVLIVIHLPILVQSQPFLQQTKEVEVPSSLKSQINGNIKQCRVIDFDGDQKVDFLVLVANDSASDPYAYEYWYNSYFKLIKRIPKYVCDADYLWFANLDDDPIPEMITAYGFEDGIDYSIYKQNLVTGKDSLLLRFNPVLLDSTNKLKPFYWGYPWDIADIVLTHKYNQTLIRCSFNHEIERDGVISIPNWQNKLPVILFYGKTTQPDMPVGAIRNFEWLDIKELAKSVVK